MYFLICMNFFLNFFNLKINKPSFKFFNNLFFLKNIQNVNIKQLNYIHIFFNLTNYLKIKIFKFHYRFYLNFIFFFILFNLLIQVFFMFI